jgi:hypothetical protein
MIFAALLDKLIAIEQAACRQDFAAVEVLTLEAEELLLSVEKHCIEELRSKNQLGTAA